MIFRPKNFNRDDDGKLTTNNLPKKWNTSYSESVVNYLNKLEPLFDKAQEKSEFDFILTLLRFRGIQSAGHDPYENSVETIDALMRMEKQLKGKIKGNVFLWVYGHIIESSEPYEIIANLLNILAGQSYRLFNFQYKETRFGPRPQYPMEKIKYLKQLAKSVGMESVTEPIIEVIDRRLRNAIFHSDYSVGHDGEVIIYNPEHIYTKREVLIILNRSLAYHEAMKNLIATYTKSYDSPKIIKVSSSFNPDPDARAQIIVREKHGVTALKASRSKQQIQDGQVAWELGNYLSYEPEMVRAGRYLLPPSRVDYWNAILKKLPSTIGKPITNFIEKNVINRKYRE